VKGVHEQPLPVGAELRGKVPVDYLVVALMMGDFIQIGEAPGANDTLNAVALPEKESIGIKVGFAALCEKSQATTLKVSGGLAVTLSRTSLVPELLTAAVTPLRRGPRAQVEIGSCRQTRHCRPGERGYGEIPCSQ